MNLPSKPVLIIAAVGVAAAVAYVGSRKLGQVFNTAADMAGDVLHAVSPLNNENVIYTSVNKVGGAVTGSADWSLGGAVYDLVHVGQYDEISIFSADGIRTAVFGDKDKTLWNFWR